MNRWVEKSIELANNSNYLDRLLEIYPVEPGEERTLPKDVIIRIKRAFESQNRIGLFRSLLDLELFPIKDPYIAFIRRGLKQRQRVDFLRLNPQTVKRVTDRIFGIGLDETLKRSIKPKEVNRQIGSMFRNWLPKMGYPLLARSRFINCKGIAILDEPDSRLLDFANRRLECELEKGPDLIAKAGSKYILGEAKFLTDFGGHQDRQFEDALNLMTGTLGNAIRIGILDGVIWLRTKNKMHKRIIS